MTTRERWDARFAKGARIRAMDYRSREFVHGTLGGMAKRASYRVWTRDDGVTELAPARYQTLVDGEWLGRL